MRDLTVMCTLALVVLAGEARATNTLIETPGAGSAVGVEMENPTLAALLGGRDVRAVYRRAGEPPTMLAGDLPSGTGLPEETAWQFIVSWGEALGIADPSRLAFQHVIDVGPGSVARWRQELDGVPVEFSNVAVATDVTGRVKWVVADVWDLSGVSTTPALDGLAAWEIASETVPMAHLGQQRTQLVLLPVGDDLRLAWKVRLGAVPMLHSNPVAFVDATSGELLLVHNALWTDRLADVYLENPVATPTLERVTLETLPAGATELIGPRTETVNCIDQHELVAINVFGMTFNVHMCSEMHQAAPDGSGDFLYVPDELAPEDSFAEVQMYHSVEFAYDYYQAQGFGLLDEVPLLSVVNLRFPINTAAPIDLSAIMAAQDPYGTLYAFDNAMFVESGGMFGITERDVDSIVFGQGTGGDFAYDGDVVTHEFGHAVVASTCALSWYTFDEQGLDTAPGALNEAYADTGAFMSTMDPVMGDYAGSWLPTSGGGIREVDVERRCPDDISGESHYDSVMFTAAEWDIAEAFPGEEDAVRQAMFAAEISLSPLSTFTEASEALIAAIETAFDASAGATARSLIEARNLIDCERVVEVTHGSPHSTLYYIVPGTGSVASNDPFVPGPLQFMFDVTRDFQQIRVLFNATADTMGSMMGGEFEPVVVFKRGPDPITFEYSGSTVTGDWTDYKVPEELSTPGLYEAFFWIPGEGIPMDQYHFTIGSAGDSGLTAYNIRFYAIDHPYPEPEPDAMEPDDVPEEVAEGVDDPEPAPDASEDPAEDPATDTGDDDDGGDGGCGCAIVR